MLRGTLSFEPFLVRIAQRLKYLQLSWKKSVESFSKLVKIDEDHTCFACTWVSAVDLSVVSGNMPLLSHVFLVCHRSHRQAWFYLWRLVSYQENCPMSSLPARWLRP